MPVIVYYDRIRHHLRGAVATFAYDEPVSGGFAASMLVCSPLEDVGQHASLAVTSSGLAAAFQGGDGTTLWYTSGATLADFQSNALMIDGGNRLHDLDGGPNQSGDSFVGAYASLVISSSDEPYVAYGDQTRNDTLVAFLNGDGWQHKTVQADGAFGSFARLAVSGGVAYVGSFRWNRNELGEDHSRFVVNVEDLPSLTPDP
jgi:hypothetical protein